MSTQHVENIVFQKSALRPSPTPQEFERIFSDLEKSTRNVHKDDSYLFGAGSVCSRLSAVLVSKGCPSSTRIESSFAAASAHSELGKMMHWFAKSVVSLFVEGVKTGVSFPHEWDTYMQQHSELNEYKFELQGFSVLFSYVLSRLAAVESAVSRDGLSGLYPAAPGPHIYFCEAEGGVAPPPLNPEQLEQARMKLLRKVNERSRKRSSFVYSETVVPTAAVVAQPKHTKINPCASQANLPPPSLSQFPSLTEQSALQPVQVTLPANAERSASGTASLSFSPSCQGVPLQGPVAEGTGAQSRRQKQAWPDRSTHDDLINVSVLRPKASESSQAREAGPRTVGITSRPKRPLGEGIGGLGSGGAISVRQIVPVVVPVVSKLVMPSTTLNSHPSVVEGDEPCKANAEYNPCSTRPHAHVVKTMSLLEFQEKEKINELRKLYGKKKITNFSKRDVQDYSQRLRSLRSMLDSDESTVESP